MAIMSQVSRDLQQILTPDWPTIFGWDGAEALPAILGTLEYRLENAGSLAKTFHSNRERLLAEFDRCQAAERPRRLRALGLWSDWQQAQVSWAALVARWARPNIAKQLGKWAVVDEQVIRRTWFDCDQAVTASDRKFTSLRNDLLDLRPYLERAAAEAAPLQRLLKQCDRVLKDCPDDGFGADLDAQRKGRSSADHHD